MNSRWPVRHQRAKRNTIQLFILSFRWILGKLLPERVDRLRHAFPNHYDRYYWKGDEYARQPEEISSPVLDSRCQKSEFATLTSESINKNHGNGIGTA